MLSAGRFTTVLSAVLVVLMSTCGSVTAQDWEILDGAQIEALLDDKRLEYDDAWQEFYANGKTLYHAGRPSWGYWRVQGDRYCSEWPPNAGWDCYDMTQSGEAVRFIDAKGNVFEGTLADLAE